MSEAPRERLLTPEDCIAAALASEEWRLRDLVSANGKAVRTIMKTLEKMDFEILSKRRGSGL